MSEKPKLYILRKYVKANNAAQAIKLDSTTKVHDVWVEDNWKEKSLADAIGFEVTKPNDDEE